MMLRQLSKSGNSTVLRIDKAICEILEMNAGMAVKVTTDGKRLIVEPIHDVEAFESLESSRRKTLERFGDAMRRLAE